MDLNPAFAKVVIDKSDREQTALRVAQQVTHQHLTGSAGTGNQHPFALLYIELPVFEPAVEKPRCAQQSNQYHGIERKDGSRDVIQACCEGNHCEADQGADQYRFNNSHHVGKRGEAPVAPIQTKVDKSSGLGNHGQR
jgi:hypothetical protein